jgi:head-tail adaptor
MARNPFSITSAATADIGLLRERIRIDAVSSTGDGMGGQPKAWNLFTVTWAKVAPLAIRGAEQLEGGGIALVETYLFTIRRRTDLVSTMRIVWPVAPVSGGDTQGSRQYNLRALNLPDTGSLYMVLKAEAGVAL